MGIEMMEHDFPIMHFQSPGDLCIWWDEAGTLSILMAIQWMEGEEHDAWRTMEFTRTREGLSQIRCYIDPLSPTSDMLIEGKFAMVFVKED
jgi:hypothetical protein